MTNRSEHSPAEFLLFVEHVGRLVLETDEQEVARIVTLTHEDDLWILDDGGDKTRWAIEKRLHQLSPGAKSDSRSLDDADEVPIWWAAPVDRLNDPGKFWAFFPTMTQSLLAGILNAPWKTNEDRQGLLQGQYNDELIDAAAAMVADALPGLATLDDPARHIDALPRRLEAGDTPHSDRLRTQLYSNLRGRAIVPDQDGLLRKVQDLSCSPFELISDNRPALERWAAYERRPGDWIHHRALTRNRLARLDRLHGLKQKGLPDPYAVGQSLPLPKASISEWLEALVRNAKSQEQIVARQVDASIRRAGAVLPRCRHRQGKGVLRAAYRGSLTGCRPDGSSDSANNSGRG